MTNEAAEGAAKQHWKVDIPGHGKDTFHQGGVDPLTGEYTHEGYDPVDPRIGEAGEAFGRFAQLGRAEHALLLLGAGLTAWHIGTTFISDYNSGHGFDNTIKAAGEEASGWAGAYLGAEILGAYGGMLGLEFAGPIGGAVGAVVGGLAGSIIGYIWGTQVFDNLTNPNYKPYSGVPCNFLGIPSFYSGAQCGEDTEM